MSLFNVLEPPDGKPDRVVFIQEGFSWAALVFTVFWALFHRMWVVATVLFAGVTGIAVAEAQDLIGPEFASIMHFAISLLFGFEARRLKVLSLMRAGFTQAGLIEATSLEAAELAYFASRAPAVAVASKPVRLPADTGDTLGIFGNV
jgi:hypothetical protein